MSKNCKVLKILLIVVVLSLIFCQKKDNSFLPIASIIVGKVDVYNSNGIESLKEQQYIKGGDTIYVQKNSKIKFELKSGALWYVNKESRLIVHDLVQISGNRRRFYLSVLNGQMHIVNNKESNEEYVIDMLDIKIRATVSDITISREDETGKCEVFLLSGFATFTVGNGTETVIPQCSKTVIYKENMPEIKSISCSDIIEIKSWIGSTIIEKALQRGSCKLLEEKAQNEPPVWKRLPNETALVNEFYLDTIEAIDPDLTPVKYILIKGPSGMELNENSGVIKFKPTNLGETQVVIEARDAQDQCCT
ncbi:MAG: FecR family protein, partial [Chitinispirillaceae bacterium]|nr:FecR family protein [Chitinispirillaceae bacterium]